MLYRKAIKDLEKWHSKPNRKPMVVWGARQVGKTFLIRNIFAESFYKGRYIYVDCKNDYNFCNYAESHPNCDEIIEYISLDKGRKIDSESLLIFDEIQECPVIVSMLKYFYQDHGDIPVIATGSMVRLKIKRDNNKRGASDGKTHLFPIGAIDQITVYPLTFDEYLYNRNVLVYDSVKKAFESMEAADGTTHDKAMSILYEYMTVGGMPAAVDCYLNSNSLLDALLEMRSIYDNYLNDMTLYQASPESVVRSKKVFEGIYEQLRKEQKNYRPSLVSPEMRNRDLIAPMDWLSMAHLIHKSKRIKDHVTSPLIGDDDFTYRIYLGDVGLFTYQSGISATSLLSDPKNVLSGIIFENYVAAELSARDIELFYWTGKNSAEIEFLVQSGTDIIPIDVKKGRGSLNSLKKYTENNSLKYAMKISANNYGYDDTSRILTVPLYMFPFFCDVLMSDGRFPFDINRPRDNI